MSTPTQENSSSEVKNDKEYNFRMMEAKYERQLAQERNARLEAEKAVHEAQKRKVVEDEDEGEDDEPYVDKKRLAKKMSAFEKRIDEKIDQKAEERARHFIEKEREEGWKKANPDFYDVMQHAQAFAEKDPELAETILMMPEGFQRQKLVYKSIKTMGLHKAASKEPSVQDKIDANRKSPYYQPSQMGTAPYAPISDFSEMGQKNAYEKLQQLKKNMRL